MIPPVSQTRVCPDVAVFYRTRLLHGPPGGADMSHLLQPFDPVLKGF